MRVPPALPLALLVAAGLWAAGRDAWMRVQAPPLSGSPGLDYVDRFAPLRPHLAGVRAASYVFDPNDYATVEQAEGDVAAAARARRATFELYLAQRALAPTLIRPEPGGTWVIGNWRDRSSVPADWAEHGLEIVADPGNGAILFRVKGK